MARGFGKTWWGEAWLQALSQIDYSNRLPRGASYARNGYVRSIEVKDGRMEARVQGRQRSPYRETIALKPYTKDETDKLVNAIVQRPSIISKLLNRELSPDIVRLAEEQGLQVFPRSWRDMQMSCSCPDWAVPCKHLAAVIYIVSQEIDSNPFLVFLLHGVDLLEELKKRNIAIDSAKAVNVPTVAETVPLAAEETEETMPEQRPVDFSDINELTDALISILPQNPAFYHNGDFHAKYAKEVTRIAKGAMRIAKGTTDLATLFDCQPATLDASTRLTLTVSDKLIYTFQTAGKGRAKGVDTQELMAGLTALTASQAADCQPSVQAFRQVLLFAIRLLAAGAIVPQIAMTPKNEAAIRWLPATIDSKVRNIVEQLNGLFPSKTCLLAKGKTKKAVAEPAVLTVSAFLSAIISSLTSCGQWTDKPLELFFRCEPKKFDELGERETPGGIRSWLERLHLSANRYRPVFVIDDDKTHEEFHLSIEVEDTQDAAFSRIPLSDIISSDDYADCRFNVLKEMSLLSSFIGSIEDYVNDGAARPITLSIEEFTPFLLNTIPAIRLLGVKVVLPISLKELLRPKASMRISAKHPDDQAHIRLEQLLNFEWSIAIGNEMLTPEEFNKLRSKAGSLIYFRQRYIYVTEEDIKRLDKELADTHRPTPAQMLQAALAEEYNHAPITLTDEVRQLLRQLTEETAVGVPPAINATLRPYQERGFSWMYRNLRLGFGCIIADDMGLGKTLQVITLLQKMKDEGWLDKKKAIIIVPTGLITNWQAELLRFAPSLTVFTYHGPGRELSAFDADILLTTYGVTRSDSNILKKQKWAVAVIDEAQNIKNTATAQTKAVKSLNADAHIAMSGTPVENRLSEYWSIMDFANKGYLGPAKKFTEDYAKPIQETNDQRVAERFRRITAPMMMRRLKTDKTIISDLPDKITIDERATLTTTQAALYEQTLGEAMKTIEGMSEEGDVKEMFVREGLVLQMILALKQICNHPTQFLKNGEAEPEQSGKTMMLLDLLDSINDSGEKAIIFTQFRKMGDLLVRFIAERTGTKPMFLHGGCSVKQRQEMVERFQTNRSDRFFILSLKAAGVGLNLTAANHVIHYDLWWNPAVEAQATDRAYRIGQKKNVMVHRFITSNTFEERINELLKEKQQLADLTVTTGEKWLGKLSNKELREIFG